MTTAEISPAVIPNVAAKQQGVEGSSTPLNQPVLLVLGAAGSFHLGFGSPFLPGMVVLYAFCLIKMAEIPSARTGFRCGFAAGILVFAPHLAWFWTIFGPPAVCLWAILSCFTGAFVSILSLCRGLGKFWPLMAGVVWTGLEYFRSELYYLRFSWLTAGFSFSGNAGLLPINTLGIYGLGLLVFTLAGTCLLLSRVWQIRAAILAAVALSALACLPAPIGPLRTTKQVQVAGIQLEFPPALAVPRYLDRVLAENPNAQIIVLSEYTFDAEVPKLVRDWCRENRRYLVAGGRDNSSGHGQFYNTAFVVGPDGETVFQQAKSVPIQFFSDGEPAPERRLWHSPWGKIAIPICYDLGFRRVMDDFVRQGAQAIIVPFMDMSEWGAHQHALHALIAPMRAREYRIPIFRVGGSGISQVVDATGEVLAEETFPGQEEILSGTLRLPHEPNLPLDRWLAPFCSGAAGLLLLAGIVRRKQNRL